LLSYRSAPPTGGLKRRHVMLAGVALLSACSSGSGLAPVPEPKAGEYILGPGDQVRIITFGEEQLTGEFGVDAGGDIALPLVGNIHAAGLTPHQLTSSIISALLTSKLYQNPSVSVEVVAYRPVFVLGEVTKPGQYPYQPGMSVVTAVAVAGGFTYRAVIDRFTIVRSTPNGPVEGSAVRETLVQPGDVITINERIF
jgi:polysaccharide export outer membrane protein